MHFYMNPSVGNTRGERSSKCVAAVAYTSFLARQSVHLVNLSALVRGPETLNNYMCFITNLQMRKKLIVFF